MTTKEQRDELRKAVKSRLQTIAAFGIENMPRRYEDEQRILEGTLALLDQLDSQQPASVDASVMDDRERLTPMICAFWRRIHPYRNDHGKELPVPLPIAFVASMATAMYALKGSPAAEKGQAEERAVDAVTVSRKDLRKVVYLAGFTLPNLATVDEDRQAYGRISSTLSQPTPSDRGVLEAIDQAEIHEALYKVLRSEVQLGPWDAGRLAEVATETVRATLRKLVGGE